MTESTIEALKKFIDEVAEAIDEIKVTEAADELTAALNHEPPTGCP